MSALRVLVKNPVKKSFYGKRKKKLIGHNKCELKGIKYFF